MDDVRKEGLRMPTLEVFDPAPAAVAVLSGPDHRITYTNLAYRAIFGERPIGRPTREALGELAQKDYFTLLDHVLITGEPITLNEAPISLFYPGSGRAERFFSFSLSRFLQDEPGVLFVAVEVTDQVVNAREAGHTAEAQRRVLRRFQSLVRVSAEVVWVTDPEGRPLEPSPGWERVTGQGYEEFREDGWLEAVHPEDREEAMRSWTAAVRSSRPWQHSYRLRTVDGGYRHFQVQAAPVYENGTVVEWVGTCTDVERDWQRNRRRELLDRAATATAEHTELHEMLGALADVLVPTLADGCGVHFLPDFADHPEGAPIMAQRIATAARAGLPELPPGGEEWFEARGGFARAIRRRRPLHRTFPPGEAPADILPKSTTDWLNRTDANSVVFLPVTVDGAVAAVVTAATCGARPPISTEDVALIGQMFDHAHDALSAAMQYHRTQRVALALQHSLLAEPPDVPGVGIVARYQASPAAAEVGGDWYDSFVLPDGAIALAIGDVSGHDLAAAVAMSQLRNMLRGLTVDRREPPGDILRRLNLAMDALAPDSTATCILVRVERTRRDEWLLSYSVAGHPPPLLVTADGDGRLLEDSSNPLLGLLVEQPYRSATQHLPPGSTLFLYTDGLVERPGEHLDRGLERLRDQASRLAAAPLPAFCDGILTGLPITGADDVALIALRVPGSP